MLETSDLGDTGVAADAATPESAPVPELSPAACAARLAELFPAVFGPGSPKPLKLRIQADLQQRAPGVFTRKVLSGFLHRHTTSTAYLRALVNAPQRVDLDGLAAGEVAAEHREAAIAELQRRRDLHDARRAAERDAQRAAERAAHDEARRARLQQDEQRRERQALLRAFEASTLTRRNFLALKGLTETQFEAMLAQARQEPAPAEAPPVLDRGHARTRAPSAPPRNFPARNKGPS
jgi:sRNA-binding protein